MRGLLSIRLFFAFVSRTAHAGKRRYFYFQFETFLFEAMAHCAWKFCARQSECLCIPSEISAKLFALQKARASAVADAPGCNNIAKN
jgi:hypothetical protein